MKPVIIAIAIIAALGVGAATFLLVRGSGGGQGGASTREGLVASTIDAINNGDRGGLLDIMVGPAADRIAADCDEDGTQESEARDKRRGQRVDDALDEAKRRKLVVDHIGDDHADVVVRKGEEIDKHCKARVNIVKHTMSIALHDGKDVPFTAELVGMEISGRWYLATIPAAMPVGAAPPTTNPTTTTLSITDFPKCAEYIRSLEELLKCPKLSTTQHDSYTAVLKAMMDTSAPWRTSNPDAAHRADIDKSCESAAELMPKASNLGC
jgi:hypothetical protein